MNRFLKIISITYLIADILLIVSFRFLSADFEKATLGLGILMMLTILPITLATINVTVKLWKEDRLSRWVSFAWTVILITYPTLFVFAQII